MLLNSLTSASSCFSDTSSTLDAFCCCSTDASIVRESPECRCVAAAAAAEDDNSALASRTCCSKEATAVSVSTSRDCAEVHSILTSISCCWTASQSALASRSCLPRAPVSAFASLSCCCREARSALASKSSKAACSFAWPPSAAPPPPLLPPAAATAAAATGWRAERSPWMSANWLRMASASPWMSAKARSPSGGPSSCRTTARRSSSMPSSTPAKRSSLASESMVMTSKVLSTLAVMSSSNERAWRACTSCKVRFQTTRSASIICCTSEAALLDASCLLGEPSRCPSASPPTAGLACKESARELGISRRGSKQARLLGKCLMCAGAGETSTAEAAAQARRTSSGGVRCGLPGKSKQSAGPLPVAVSAQRANEVVDGIIGEPAASGIATEMPPPIIVVLAAGTQALPV
mmetsp:Transcript_4031/g.13565  ORF Transcript_4031/g.13565 Transcript_4031/m.13565 type:complete len:408 (-) Transcript_4031:172-1395(-)